MGMHSLPPGFRFHPTAVELIMYFLKRKVMGRKLGCEVISELDIYKFTPWDLPDKSCLKTEDLKWYFLCPLAKKYGNGSRTSRSTDIGYWKVTGKDRPVHYKGRLVGLIKTLIFHVGRAPKGDRTDWVMHEYRLQDSELAGTGIVQASYVLCEFFHKSGLGPKNGAQYGAPFNEEDWDDYDSEAQCAAPFFSLLKSPINPRMTNKSPHATVPSERAQSLAPEVNLSNSEQHQESNPIAVSTHSLDNLCTELSHSGGSQTQGFDLLHPEIQHLNFNPSDTNGSVLGGICDGLASELQPLQTRKAEVLNIEDVHPSNAIVTSGSVSTVLSPELGCSQAREANVSDQDVEYSLMLASLAEEDILNPREKGFSENMLFDFTDGNFLEQRDLDRPWDSDFPDGNFLEQRDLDRPWDSDFPDGN